MLSIKNLYVFVEDKEIFKGINLEIKFGEVYVIMGLNGFGKSILFQVLVGNEVFEVISGEIILNGDNLLELEIEEWVCEGIFLVFQYLVEILGVSNLQFLCIVVNVMCVYMGELEMNVVEFMKLVKEVFKQVDLDFVFLKCGVNEGFFGGEKKCNEIMQVLFLQLKLVIFDEIDFGFDIDVLKVVFDGVNVLCLEDCVILMVIYYQCLLNYIVLDYVYVLVGGKIIKFGGCELVLELEECGYGWFGIKDEDIVDSLVN